MIRHRLRSARTAALYLIVTVAVLFLAAALSGRRHLTAFDDTLKPAVLVLGVILALTVAARRIHRTARRGRPRRRTDDR